MPDTLPTSPPDPLTQPWEMAGELGKPWPQENVYIVAYLGDSARTIILSNVPLRLAERIVKMQNEKVLAGL